MNKSTSKFRRMNPLLFMGLIGMFTIGTNFAVQIHHAYWGNQDIWWTPLSMQLPIESSKDSFQLFISGKQLQKHLADGSLFAVDNNGKQYPIVAKDVTIRLNNWHKVRSSILTNAMISGIAFGVVITVLVIGIIQVCGQKRLANKPDAGDA